MSLRTGQTYDGFFYPLAYTCSYYWSPERFLGVFKTIFLNIISHNSVRNGSTMFYVWCGSET